MGFLTLTKPKHEKQQELKARVLKNREGVLDALSEGMKGARTCPKLLGQKCIGSFCEFFMQLYSFDDKGNKKEFYRCAVVETPLLLIELNESIRKLTAILTKENK